MRKSLGGSGPIQALEARSIFIIEVVYRRQKIRRCPGVTSGCHVLYIFFTESDCIYKNPIKKKNNFFSKLSARGRHVFLPLRGVSFEKNHQNGVERGRRTATLPHFCNHDVDEQQAAFQYAPHPARTQIHSSALQLRGHPQSLPSHTVGESRNHS